MMVLYVYKKRELEMYVVQYYNMHSKEVSPPHPIQLRVASCKEEAALNQKHFGTLLPYLVQTRWQVTTIVPTRCILV